MNKVSVIIPCYNAERFVAECLLSVLAQTHKNFEIICVNDGSSDNSLKILNEFQVKYPGIIFVVSTPNGGASKARNLGLAQAKGDFVQFLDADDIINSDKFERQLEGFSSDVDVVISDRAQKNIDFTKTLETFHFADVILNPLETAVTKIITTCNPLYRKDLVIKLGGYDESLSSCQDWDFHLRLVMSNFRIAYVPGVFFVNREVPGSLSSNWLKVFIQSTSIIENIKKQMLSSRMMNEKIRNHIAGIYFNSAIYCENKSDAFNYTKEMRFWSDNYSFNSIIKEMIAKVFGYYRLVLLLRMFKKSRY
ncbi:MAG TPA: glycosyltransferase family A protein [Bacteroidia bacterium]|jgi:glycosyltransferase involved in cell wall biosynthesis